jgi:RNA polymerase sigma factor (sigma-70 family)
MGTQRETEERVETPAGELDRREIFDAYYGRVLGFFKSRGFAEEEARDLTQETFASVFQHMGNLRIAASRDAYILRTAANLWKNRLRYHRARKRDAREVSLDGAETDREAVERAALAARETPSPLDDALASERLGAVRKCLEGLPPRMRRCLVLHVFQERKYQEIADLLELSIESVKSHIHQARKRLGECVARRLAGGAP